VSPTLYVNPTLFVIACNFFWNYRFRILQLLSLTKQFFIQNFNHLWQFYITSCWLEKVGFWAVAEFIHHPWRSLIHKKCHPKSYHRDIKYHITLNIIFSVVAGVELFWFSLQTLLTSKRNGSSISNGGKVLQFMCQTHQFFWSSKFSGSCVRMQRLQLLAAAAFCQGASLGTLVEQVLSFNPR